MSIKLNIGGGGIPVPGFTEIDRANGQEAYPLAYPDDSVDEIRASHILEHFDHKTSFEALREWVRVLKPGGRIRLAVPDFAYCAQGYLEGRKEPFASYVFGGQTNAEDYHRTCFDEERLRYFMESCGLVGIERWKDDINDCSQLPCSLNLEGTKAGTVAKELATPFPRHRKIAAVMSMPRLAFADNMFCALQALTPLQIPFEKVTGAFWGPCLTRIIEPHLNDGTEWILTLDYDTVFDIKDIHRLAVLMEQHPEADAIAPIQFKRDEDTHLFRPIDETTGEYRTGEMTLEEFSQNPLLRVGWAHFGLTLFRVSALKRMAKPWFLGVPDSDGRWGDGRTDDDIYFWENFRKSGNKLFLATGVTVGHLQLMASWAGQDMKPIHQYVSQYHRAGKPQEARR